MPGLLVPGDYHLHTARCGHATGALSEYVDRAKKIGLAEIGFSDHLPLFHTIDSTLAMSWDEWPLYLADIGALSANSTGPRVKLGVEADYIPKHAGRVAGALADHDFDYVLGSVHFVDGWGIDDRRYIDNYRNYRLEDVYDRYFKLVIEAAGSGLFDIMAHIDLIKKFHRLEPEPLDLLEKVADALASAGVAIEYSSAGLRKPCREAYPGPTLLRLCREREIPVTLGSDAHAPTQVGDNFKYLLEELRSAGYSELAVFSGRQRRMVEIDWSLLEILPAT